MSKSIHKAPVRDADAPSVKPLPPRPAKPEVSATELDAFADEAMTRYDKMFKALAK
ncbi:hypothetical protein [Oceanibaculum nanhaiense]|jgi:hypothetical protein|uniref:hypothetical protein n=1 Tax=Oceanibaculum nanhaiense TaxID=1909734 RepID=UPI001592E409|nr:hypothetical protein [Oceanibaculum nanhaiense]MBC7134258.1 hypothetical protein [Oceanibaculum nanhaiense]|tara:strand:- start:21 stop:188 length:168 start_codon:yes stop_codon:yes gene_type:complete